MLGVSLRWVWTSLDHCLCSILASFWLALFFDRRSRYHPTWGLGHLGLRWALHWVLNPNFAAPHLDVEAGRCVWCLGFWFYLSLNVCLPCQIWVSTSFGGGWLCGGGWTSGPGVCTNVSWQVLQADSSCWPLERSHRCFEWFQLINLFLKVWKTCGFCVHRSSEFRWILTVPSATWLLGLPIIKKTDRGLAVGLSGRGALN